MASDNKLLWAIGGGVAGYLISSKVIEEKNAAKLKARREIEELEEGDDDDEYEDDDYDDEE